MKSISQKSGYFILVTLGILVSGGCSSGREWKPSGDSCITESEKPPLSRVVNYTDAHLCQRVPPPFKPVPLPVRNPCDPH